MELIPEKLDEPLHWKKPRRVFVNSMSDLFHERLSNAEIAAVFGVMAASPLHTFQILTKRLERMLAWTSWVENVSPPGGGRVSPGVVCAVESRGRIRGAAMAFPTREESDGLTRIAWPLPNVWLGVSVEDQATADERIPLLLQTPAAVRFVSYEPALGPVDFEQLREGTFNALDGIDFEAIGDIRDAGIWKGQPAQLDWLIVGGESGPGARPFDLAWARSAVAQCKAAGVPVFVKQLGARPCDCLVHGRRGSAITGGQGMRSVRLADYKGGTMEEWPEDLRVREFPS